jgi:hypothetical protein
MQQASSTEIQDAFQKARQAFSEIDYPATKQQLIDKAEEYNARSEVIRALENCPDKQYNRPGDVIQECRGKFNW